MQQRASFNDQNKLPPELSQVGDVATQSITGRGQFVNSMQYVRLLLLFVYFNFKMSRG